MKGEAYFHIGDHVRSGRIGRKVLRGTVDVDAIFFEIYHSCVGPWRIGLLGMRR